MVSFDGVAAFAQNIEAGLGCERMRGDDGAPPAKDGFHDVRHLRFIMYLVIAKPWSNSRRQQIQPIEYRSGGFCPHHMRSFYHELQPVLKEQPEIAPSYPELFSWIDKRCKHWVYL